MQLSEHFHLDEFTRSNYAARHGIDNEPANPAIIENLRLLCERVLEPVREQFGPTVISSGYRCPELNVAVGGSPSSQHREGKAADFGCPSAGNLQIARWIEATLDFDQLILEFYVSGEPSSGWVHCSWDYDARNSVLTAQRIKRWGKWRTIYLKGLVP